MPLKNKVSAFVESLGISPYEFIKQTGISPNTGYSLVNDPNQYLAKGTMRKICSTYKVQPGDLIEWIDDTPSVPSTADMTVIEQGNKYDFLEDTGGNQWVKTKATGDIKPWKGARK